MTIEMLIGEITEKIEKLETHLVVYQDGGSEGSSGNHDFLPYSVLSLSAARRTRYAIKNVTFRSPYFGKAFRTSRSLLRRFTCNVRK